MHEEHITNLGRVKSDRNRRSVGLFTSELLQMDDELLPVDVRHSTRVASVVATRHEHFVPLAE